MSSMGCEWDEETSRLIVKVDGHIGDGMISGLRPRDAMHLAVMLAGMALGHGEYWPATYYPGAADEIGVKALRAAAGDPAPPPYEESTVPSDLLRVHVDDLRAAHRALGGCIDHIEQLTEDE